MNLRAETIIFVSLAFTTVPGTECVQNFFSDGSTFSSRCLIRIPPGSVFIYVYFLCFDCPVSADDPQLIATYSHHYSNCWLSTIARISLFGNAATTSNNLPNSTFYLSFLSDCLFSCQHYDWITIPRQNCFHHGALSCVSFYVVGIQNARDKSFMSLNIKLEHKYTQ